MRRRVTAVILAGGASARFGGRDKAFATWKGKPFISRVVDAVAGTSDAFLVLVAPGAEKRTYAERVPGATVVPDRVAHAGPVEALRGAWALVRTPTVLVVPCDAPGLTPALARRLVALSEEGGRPVVATPPTGPVWTMFAAPAPLIAERLPTANRMEDLVGDAERAETDAPGLNVNEPPR